MPYNWMQVILQADQRPQQNHKNEILSAHPQELYLLEKEFRPMLKQENIQSPIMKCRRNWFVWSLPRDDDGAVEFWRIKDNLQTFFLYCHHLSDNKWKSSMAGGGGNKKRFQHCTDSSGAILYLRALQGHSGQSLIDPTLQDNVIIPHGFFKYIYHVGCAINHIPSSIQDWYREVRNWQQTDSILSACGSHGPKPSGSWQDRLGSTASCTIHAQSMEETSKYGVLGRHQPCSEERIEVLSDTIERIILHEMLHQLTVSLKLFEWKPEKSYTRKYMRHLVLLQRFPWKHDGMKELGSEVV